MDSVFLWLWKSCFWFFPLFFGVFLCTWFSWVQSFCVCVVFLTDRIMHMQIYEIAVHTHCSLIYQLSWNKLHLPNRVDCIWFFLSLNFNQYLFLLSRASHTFFSQMILWSISVESIVGLHGRIFPISLVQEYRRILFICLGGIICKRKWSRKKQECWDQMGLWLICV